MTSLVPLIEASRGGTPEVLHFGAVAVADTQGRVVASAGDPRFVTFTRSTLKPFQSLAFVEAGGPQALGFTREQVAMTCASHSGEPMHVQQVQGMLDKAGLTYQRLQCGCHVPYFVELGQAAGEYDERHHNCSGKHTGMLAFCVHRGWPVDSYVEANHPVQQAIRSHVARAVGMREDELKVGTDGCSVPNYAMPLANLARAYARLATGSADPEFGDSFAQLADAMTAHPDLVSGTGRLDLALMRSGRGDWVSKAGADGVQAVASRSRGEAIAVKITDGAKQAVAAVAVEVMDQLGWLDDSQREELRPWRSATITNVRGAAVGERKPVFRLQAGASR
jgi:L-asparaginase II